MVSIRPDKPVPPIIVDLLTYVDAAARKFSVRYFVAGAFSRDLILTHVHGIDLPRPTRDVDLGMAVESWEQFAQVKKQLTDSGKFTEVPGLLHRLRFGGKSGIPLDIVPFAGVQDGDATLRWPPDRSIVMNVAGFEDALATAQLVAVSEVLAVPVTSLSGLALMKLFAWLDRRHQSAADAIDLMLLLRRYGEAGNNERLYRYEPKLLAETDFDIERAGSILLGKDVRAIALARNHERLTAAFSQEPIRQAFITHIASGVSHAEGEDRIAKAELLVTDFFSGFGDQPTGVGLGPDGVIPLTAYHAKYYAHDLTRCAPAGMDRLSMSLFDASVDLNPHQIEAALFAMASPLSQGVILADEVGLGKTIEAGIVLCQMWAERRRRLIVICPASLRKQWALELQEKFSLPVLIMDARSLREARRAARIPLDEVAVIVMSFNFAHTIREELKAIAWDLVVIDEAHKLRNAYRPSNIVGQGIRWATEGRRKLLLTATPLQNSLLELYGLATLIDEHLFGDVNSFRSRYVTAGGNLAELRQRLSSFCKRTLRNQVTEYVRYTERHALTRPFTPSDDEHALYEAVSTFLQRAESYALPKRQRHLTALILRKLLASSSPAIAATLDILRQRLEKLRDEQVGNDPSLAEQLITAEEMEDDLLDEVLEEDTEADEPIDPIDRKKLREEIDELRRLADWAARITNETKSKALLAALDIGFVRMNEIGAQRKALIFTESRRTQEHLKAYLESHGYAGQVVLFNGTNGGPEATAIYERWLEHNRDSGRSSGSRALDVRTALIEHFRDRAAIMIATEAGAEGVNLQFCSLVINYDLPWNPQRIEQRIGRCHRYNQKHDVVVINFLNERNEADRRVLEILEQKFNLFSGVFGASDEILGTIESGVDFEKRILTIYQECRTPEEIESAFAKLRDEMDASIRERLNDTRRLLFEHFDEDVHQRLRLQLADARARLDHVGRRFWAVTHKTLEDRARFYDDALAFDLNKPPAEEIPSGRYHLISKGDRVESDESNVDRFLYRLSHPLGEWVVSTAKAVETPPAKLVFDASSRPARVHAVEALRGRSGYLKLNRLVIDSYDREEYLLFSGFDERGAPIDQETTEKLFGFVARVEERREIPANAALRLSAESNRHSRATVSRSLEQNSVYFNEAREKLEKWAEDRLLAAEKALKDTKEQIKAHRRASRQAVNLDEQRDIQEKIKKLEKQQQKQRQEIFKVEDEIMKERDELIDRLERRLAQKTATEELFTVEWEVR